MSIFFNTYVMILAWYALAGMFIAFFILFFRFVNMPKWRDDHGDRTSEAGYFEDSIGRIIPNPLNDEGHEEGSVSAPHVQA